MGANFEFVQAGERSGRVLLSRIAAEGGRATAPSRGGRAISRERAVETSVAPRGLAILHLCRQEHRV